MLMLPANGDLVSGESSRSNDPLTSFAVNLPYPFCHSTSLRSLNVYCKPAADISQLVARSGTISVVPGLYLTSELEMFRMNRVSDVVATKCGSSVLWMQQYAIVRVSLLEVCGAGLAAAGAGALVAGGIAAVGTAAAGFGASAGFAASASFDSAGLAAAAAL